MNEETFKLIIFGNRKKNQPHNCFMVGIMGCSSIIENHLGTKGGIDMCSYTVHFDNETSIEIKDAIYVSA